jgi:hypothetical protein
VAKKTDPKDPRFRRFRMAAYGIYLVVVTVFSVGIVASVFRSVNQMSPRRPPEVDQVLTPGECTERLDGLWQRLEAQRHSFSQVRPARSVDEKYTRFRVEWMRDFRILEGQCAVDARARRALRTAFRRLEDVQDAYTISATQYAGETGPHVDRFTAALDAARRGDDGEE